MRRRLIPLRFWWIAALPACTPLGVWVYEEPELEVARVRVSSDTAADSTVLVALALRNPNDYDLSTTRFELQLQLDDHTVGSYVRDSIVPLPRIATATLDLPFIPPSGGAKERLAALRSGTHRFVVEGRAVYRTPFGKRNVRVAHAGDMAFGAPGEGGSSTAGNAEPRRGLPVRMQAPAISPMVEPRPQR
jgi:hypothetical protein